MPFLDRYPSLTKRLQADSDAIVGVGAALLGTYVVAPLVVKRYWNRIGAQPITRRQARAGVVVLVQLAALAGNGAYGGVKSARDLAALASRRTR